MKLEPRERLIVALDVPSVAQAEALVARLGETISFYKIGYALAFAGGIDFARALAGAGKSIFLDLKGAKWNFGKIEHAGFSIFHQGVGRRVSGVGSDGRDPTPDTRHPIP